MPYVYDPNLDNEKQQQQSQVPSGSSVQLSSGSSTSDPSGGQAKGQKEFNTGSGFQNLDKYFQANAGNNLGQQLTDKVGNVVNTAKQDQTDTYNKFDDAENNFNNAVKSSTPADNSKIDSYISNPNASNASEYQSWLNQTYQGPTAPSYSINQQDWNKLSSDSNQAKTQTQALQNEGGRYALLNNYFNRPGYNSGEKGLDNFLVQNSNITPQAQALQNQALQIKSVNQLQDEERSRSDQAAALAAQMQKNVQSSRDYANAALTGARKQVNDQVSSETDTENTNRANQLSDFVNRIQSGQLTSDDLNYFQGIDPNSNIYNTDLRSYLNPEAALNANQVMNSTERSRLLALDQLGGIANDPNAVEQTAGGAYNYNSAKLRSDIQAAQNNYLNEGYGLLDQYQPGTAHNQSSLDLAPLIAKLTQENAGVLPSDIQGPLSSSTIDPAKLNFRKRSSGSGTTVGFNPFILGDGSGDPNAPAPQTDNFPGSNPPSIGPGLTPQTMNPGGVLTDTNLQSLINSLTDLNRKYQVGRTLSGGNSKVII